MAEQSMSSKKKRHRASNHCHLLADYHLLITTEQQIIAWHEQGIFEVLYQEGGAIAAAQQAKDGTELLAVANGWVVVLRERNGKPSKSWNLRRAKVGRMRTHFALYLLTPLQDRVTLMRFTNNFQELLYSTCLQNFIVRYNVAKNEIIGYSCTHPSPPTAFAISADSQYLITASASPPTLQLQSMTSASSPVLIRPYASDSHVTVVQFHPHREDIFLLAYADGTLSVHTMSRIILMQETDRGSDGGLGHLSRVHRHRGRRHGSSIIAASFIGSYKLRTVSLTAGGRCRIVDFERGATILRTWYMNTECTCMSVTSLESRVDDDTSRYPTASHGSESDFDRRHMIAIGRADGYVMLYDTLGIPLDSRLIDRGRRPIMDLEWMSEVQANATPIDTGTPDVKAVADVKWANASSAIPINGCEIDKTVYVPERVRRPRRNIIPDIPRFRPKRSPRKSDPKHPVHRPLDSPDIPGAWISSSDSLSTTYTARTTQKDPSEVMVAKSRRFDEMVANEVLTPVKQRSIPGRNIFNFSTTSKAKTRSDHIQTMKAICDLSKRREQGTSEALPSVLPNEAIAIAPPYQMMAVPEVSPYDLQHLSTPVQSDGAGPHEVDWTPKEPSTVTKFRAPQVTDLTILPRPQPPVTPPQSPMKSTISKSTPPKLIPSLASLAQRLRISSSAGDDRTVIGDNYSATERSKRPVYSNQSISPGMHSIDMNIAKSPTSDKPLPAPPSPSVDLFTDSKDPFFSPYPLSPPSEHSSPLMKPLPSLPHFESCEHANSDAAVCGENQALQCRCECDCAEVIREEMGLLRAEVASLRKTIWCFGSGTGWGRLVDPERRFGEGNLGDEGGGGGFEAGTEGEMYEGVTGSGDYNGDGGGIGEGCMDLRGGVDDEEVVDEEEWKRAEREWAGFESG